MESNTNQAKTATDNKRVLVLGATGGIGGEVARQLRDAGWTVIAMNRQRSTDREVRDGITWLKGDALIPEEVANAAKGCSVIVHAVNPPGYRQWDKLVLPMLNNTLAAARQENATVLLPGNVYNYGPDAFPVIDEAAEQHPTTKKGAIRVEMEQRLRKFAEAGGQAIIVRAGDYFGPRAAGNWFSQALVQPERAVRSIKLPNQSGVGHLWSYLPDVAHTMVLLMEQRRTLPSFANYHLSGHWDEDGRQMAETIQKVVERSTGKRPSIAGFPWWLIKIVAPFQETMREILNMRYLWQQPVRMSNAQLLQTLGEESQTPLEQAIETTLRDLKCIP